MSQCDRVLAVLADGHPHTIDEIHDRAGTMRLNSRVAELRKRGHDIVCTRDGATYRYQLVSLGEPGPEETAWPHRPTLPQDEPVDGFGSSPGSPSDSEQLSLLEVAA